VKTGKYLPSEHENTDSIRLRKASAFEGPISKVEIASFG
jgi:hypothetical protein